MDKWAKLIVAEEQLGLGFLVSQFYTSIAFALAQTREFLTSQSPEFQQLVEQIHRNFVKTLGVFHKNFTINRTISGNSYYLVLFQIVLYRGSY